MIDTIILRVLNLSKYDKLYEQYYAPSKRKNTTTIGQLVNTDTGEVTDLAAVTSYIYHDTNRVLPLVHRSTINIASSHYSVSYSINKAGDYLEFNFSIPKYIYTTNVMQFVNIYDQSVNTTFLELKKFLHTFIRDHFIEEPLKDDLEINRIDICYNQFFNSKEDALSYLDEQKKLLVKYARSSKNNYRSYDTSLMYITKRYSFKIYHKGTEFEKNDYKELVKNGNPKDLPLQYFLDQSDCILRYEMTFRRSMLNYLVNHYFFVSKGENLHPQYSEHVLSRTFKNLIVFGYKEFYEKYKKKHKKFTLQSVFDVTNDFMYLFDADTITFDETIFQILHRVFYKKVKDFQLTTILSPGEVLNRIDTANADNKIKNSLRRTKKSGKDSWRLLSVALLQQVMNLEELKQFMPKSTFYDLKKDLKTIGIKTGDTSLTIPQPKLDYFDYKLYFSKFH
ncbi:MAG: hypothetical protein JWQ09_1126 [Segetibacter sp.]|nr:hypothetical protein [Segetibacter sp.]